MQKDNEPCLYLETRHVEVRNNPPACKNEHSTADCRDQHAEIWMFEKWGTYNISTTFFEEYSSAWNESDSKGRLKGCAKGEWLLGSEHTCGIGRGYRGKWRHLDHNGRSLIEDDESSLQRKQKRVAVKMEEDLAKMDIDDGVKIKREPIDDFDTEN